MLKNLNIIDLAVVESLDLDLKKGMSVLTGETGAGKSILLTALGLALGDRADSGYVRPGSKRAEINLEFDLSDAVLAREWLEENDLDDGPICLIRRIVSQEGPSKAYINNRPVTLQLLQTLSAKLVEIHGQHAHLQLLHGAAQRELLDGFGGHEALVDQLNLTHREWNETVGKLQSLSLALKNGAEREELLRYQIRELQQLDLDAFDYPALSEEHCRQANFGKILTGGQTQLDILYENEEQSVDRMLGHCVNALAELASLAPELEEVTALLAEAQIQIDEASQQLRRFLESQEADPQRMEWLENQIGIIHKLSRKHQVAPERLPELAEQLTAELDGLCHSGEQIDELKETASRLEADYHRLALKLSEGRKASAAQLEQRISSMIRELGMPQGRFLVSVAPLDNPAPRPYGTDLIEFLVSANPGLPPRPLGKVASGGELSRISLAIQVATSNDKTIPTMIFDEVDSGIGGGIAEIVGKRLRSLSGKRQVLCVTHLPQVASQAHHHLYVAKTNRTDMTSTHVKPLDENERISEVARMLGGVQITDQTLAHAREMLELGGGAQ
ncbi:MAG: DNA repair protein RecN [Gammaproteobacteria bacterium]